MTREQLAEMNGRDFVTCYQMVRATWKADRARTAGSTEDRLRFQRSMASRIANERERRGIDIKDITGILGWTWHEVVDFENGIADEDDRAACIRFGLTPDFTSGKQSEEDVPMERPAKITLGWRLDDVSQFTARGERELQLVLLGSGRVITQKYPNSQTRDETIRLITDYWSEVEVPCYLGNGTND